MNLASVNREIPFEKNYCGHADEYQPLMKEKSGNPVKKPMELSESIDAYVGNMC
jgi:hypothetical protein